MKINQPVVPELTESDKERIDELLNIEITPEQRQRIAKPERCYPRQTSVLAVHWHPEFLPMDLILERIGNTFPDKQHELLIPTQHNTILTLDGYCGVEVDCYSRAFNRKVQLLIHFEENNKQRASTFSSMLTHTYRYRSGQLHLFIDYIILDRYRNERTEAAAAVGADEELMDLLRKHTQKVSDYLNCYHNKIPSELIRNKLLKNYFDTLTDVYDENTILRLQALLKSIKNIVKRQFSPEFFYETEEIIEEARSLNAGIIIPHPEQFWPILLADYDIDGIEVWNPQSQEYTDFLINVVNRENSHRRHSRRRLLIFMGDDCHMGEKIKDPEKQDPEKGSREIGVQPPWDDLTTRKSLIVAGFDRDSVMNEYRARMSG